MMIQGMNNVLGTGTMQILQSECFQMGGPVLYNLQFWVNCSVLPVDSNTTNVFHFITRLDSKTSVNSLCLSWAWSQIGVRHSPKYCPSGFPMGSTATQILSPTLKLNLIQFRSWSLSVLGLDHNLVRATHTVGEPAHSSATQESNYPMGHLDSS